MPDSSRERPGFEGRNPVEVSAPDYSLQKKIGAKAESFFDARALAKADAALQSMKSQCRESLLTDVQTLREEASREPRPDLNVAFDLAHNIRGLATTVDLADLGRACDLICFYLSKIECRPPVDRELLVSLTHTAFILGQGQDLDAIQRDKLYNAARSAVELVLSRRRASK